MSEEKKKHPGGRPTVYKEQFCKAAYRACLLGATDAEIAEIIGVSEQTINTWKTKHPKFLESIKAGKEEADSKVADALFKRATGYSHKDTKFATHEGMITDRQEYEKHYAPDPTACIFWLKNRQKDKWRDKQEIDHKGSMIVHLDSDDAKL